MIPARELCLLRRAIHTAWALGEEGQLAEGYTVLDAGILWAETPPMNASLTEHEAPEPWSEALAILYRSALMRYADEFGTSIPALAPVLPECVPGATARDAP
jgi:hypothetical protein